MNVSSDSDQAIAKIAAAIGEPARVRILYCLLDGHARTSTELAIVAGVSPSTTSVHLNRLKLGQLVRLFTQGKHRYYSLEGEGVARALEALNVIAAGSRNRFAPNTPNRLLTARTCYDHIAGRLGVLLCDRLKALGWLSANPRGDTYEITLQGTRSFAALRIDLEAIRKLRRRLAYACIDWSERRPHVGGALGAALLSIALKRKWVVPDLDSRALHITGSGRREMLTQFGLRI